MNSLVSTLLLLVSFIICLCSPPISCAFSLPSPPHHVFSVPCFIGVGITSIIRVQSQYVSEREGGSLPLTTDKASRHRLFQFYVGTKRGRVRHISIPSSWDSSVTNADIVVVSDVMDEHHTPAPVDGKIQLKPYPVYAIQCIPKHQATRGLFSHDLLTAGGDRYITIWEASRTEEDETYVHPKQQLGPHTGWVKDLASYECASSNNSSDESYMLFSIGCNCIEVWTCVNNEYNHACKLQIGSSVEMGSTLSSDLLCLSTYTNQQYESYLIAGGVDGRLHRWKLPSSIEQANRERSFVNAGATAAHDGRVNGVVICKALNMVASIGNDGCINCRQIRDLQFEEWEVSSLDLNVEEDLEDLTDVTSSSIKANALCIVLEEANRAVIAIGTSCGTVCFVNIIKEYDYLKTTLLGGITIPTQTKNGDGGIIIHTMSSFRGHESGTIVVGHSNGLSVLRVDLK